MHNDIEDAKWVAENAQQNGYISDYEHDRRMEAIKEQEANSGFTSFLGVGRRF